MNMNEMYRNRYILFALPLSLFYNGAMAADLKYATKSLWFIGRFIHIFTCDSLQSTHFLFSIHLLKFVALWRNSKETFSIGYRTVYVQLTSKRKDLLTSQHSDIWVNLRKLTDVSQLVGSESLITSVENQIFFFFGNLINFFFMLYAAIRSTNEQIFSPSPSVTLSLALSSARPLLFYLFIFFFLSKMFCRWKIVVIANRTNEQMFFVKSNEC